MEYFVDTNFFLHCKKYDEIDWSEITSDLAVTILIPRVVQQEIDKLKNDSGNSRRAEKARKINQLFSTMLDTDTLSIEKRVGNIQVALKFAANYSLEQLKKDGDGLDLSRNDDIILSGVKKYITETENPNCSFLSNDTGALTSAKYCGISCVRIPDTWLLPVENDQRDKKIIALRKELEAYQNKEPKIEVSFIFKGIKIDKSPFNFDYLIYQLPDKEELDAVSKLYFTRHPLQTMQSIIDANKTSLLSMFYNYEPPSVHEYSEYEKKYAKWKESFTSYLHDYIARKNKYQNIVPFIVYISNSGNTPLKDMIVEFEVLQGGNLFNIPSESMEAYFNDFNPPKIPDPPHGRVVEKILSAINPLEWIPKNAISSMNLYELPPITDPYSKHEHDPYAFYYKQRPDGKSKFWSLTCDLFPHKRDPEAFEYHFFLDFNSDNRFKFKVTISGSNLSVPVSHIYTLSINKTYIPYKDDILVELNLAN
jgi:hypothetical protein